MFWCSEKEAKLAEPNEKCMECVCIAYSVSCKLISAFPEDLEKYLENCL